MSGHMSRKRRDGHFLGKHVLILGLGKFGGALCYPFLSHEGAFIRVSDSGQKKDPSHSIDQLTDCEIEYHF